jgi:hypothetical protein
VLLSPLLVELGVMVFGVVHYDYNAPTRLPTGVPKLFEEHVECLGVESVCFPTEHKLPVA